jgi:hypothetical protein
MCSFRPSVSLPANGLCLTTSASSFRLRTSTRMLLPYRDCNCSSISFATVSGDAGPVSTALPLCR